MEIKVGDLVIRSLIIRYQNTYSDSNTTCEAVNLSHDKSAKLISDSEKIVIHRET